MKVSNSPAILRRSTKQDGCQHAGRDGLHSHARHQDEEGLPLLVPESAVVQEGLEEGVGMYPSSSSLTKKVENARRCDAPLIPMKLRLRDHFGQESWFAISRRRLLLFVLTFTITFIIIAWTTLAPLLHTSSAAAMYFDTFNAAASELSGLLSSSEREKGSQNIPRRALLVPNIIHYVFIWPSGMKDLPYWVFLNIMSAVMVQRPEKVILHVVGADPQYLQATAGRNWQRLVAMEGFRVVQERDVHDIFGNPVNVVAHKADIIRLEALMAEGGIYLDTDVILLRPLDRLMQFPMVMGMEQHAGLGNAILISTRNATFLQKWYQRYETFNDSQWAEHSILVPRWLAEEIPTEIVMVPMSAFFRPFYSEVNSDIFNPDRVIIDLAAKQYALHLWHKVAKPHLDRVSSEEYFCNLAKAMNNTYFHAIYPTVIALGECQHH